ncbi:MAG: penicillin-binding protein 1C [Proteobacteria bacterium]|nr:penicillin-binding protein 1C [Pseudomonadota bacterium]
MGEPGSVVVYYRDGSPIHVFLSPDEKWRVPVLPDDIDSRYIESLLRFEDKRFYYHPGVDFVALARAVVVNLREGRVVTGASTITMQLVRVLEPRPRTIRSKVVEMHRALTLELRLSKEEILSAYMTFAPFGRNIEGIEAASLSYFGHRANELSDGEIAVLLAVPQNPNRRYPRRENEARLRLARDDIAHFLNERAGVLSDLNALRKQAVPKVLRPFPRDVPHAAIWLRDANPQSQRLHTTLDRGVQRVAEKSLRKVRVERQRQGIHNTSAVVVDHTVGEVRALVGNFDFWDEDHGGQIVGFDQPRSPGSALKPFIYAMSIDRGHTLPEHLVLDVPANFHGYAPKNYDGEFLGLVRNQEALSKSLNLPFIFQLRRIGVDSFVHTLQVMGAQSLMDDPGYYGLSVAAGGIELTALEMAGFYAALANNGRYRPLLVQPDGSTRGGLEIFSPGASYLTRRALAKKDRPDFPSRMLVSSAPRHISWKTGTSFGHRDAWAAGSGVRYTAVVWMGNFDNSASSLLVGSEASGEVLFNILEGVADTTMPILPPQPPTDLIEVEVCAYWGRVPTRACPRRQQVLARETHVPTEECPFHLEVEVDLASGLAVGPGCRGGETEMRQFVTWPASVRRWLRDQHRHLPEPPSYAAGCRSRPERRAPVIVNPSSGQVAALIPGIAASDQDIPLEVDAPADARLSWFVDGEFLGTTSADKRLWWTPMVGSHELLVIDERGQSAKRILEVKAP